MIRQNEKKGLSQPQPESRQGVVFAAQRLGMRAVIVMPVTTPRIKVDAVRGYGGEVILHGDNYSEAAERAAQLVAETGMVFIHPFDDELVIAGQGTVADEILRQNPGVWMLFLFP